MKKKQLITTIVLVIAALFAQQKSSQSFKIAVPFGKAYNYDSIRVTRVIDGDTLRLENGERVRLIGIDTPESGYNDKLYRDAKATGQDTGTIIKMGKEASRFTRDLVEGKDVSIEFDVQKRDRYGRLLAYVYIRGKPNEKKGTPLFLNAEIIKAGYANLMTIPPNVKYTSLFQKLYKEAKNNKSGLWKGEK